MSETAFPEQHQLLKILLEPLRKHLAEAMRQADSLCLTTFLVGGVVRDLIIGKHATDLDLVIVGDAISFGRQLSHQYAGEFKYHTRFGTASVVFPDGVCLDLATARSERYEHSGALPSVVPSNLTDDLLRRDFSINAMAIGLTGERAGEFIDPFLGLQDLENHVIRVLHPQSFIDDPTRLFRAVRFEQRLGFHLEDTTLGLFLDAVKGELIRKLTPERLKEQIRLTLQEDHPWAPVSRLYELNAWNDVFPGLEVGCDAQRIFSGVENWLAEGRDSKRIDETVVWHLYLLALISGCDDSPGSIEKRLNLETEVRVGIRRLNKMREIEFEVKQGALKSASGFYTAACGIPDWVVLYSGIASEVEGMRHLCMNYYLRDRHVRTEIDGHTLESLGIPNGPIYRVILDAVLSARLDGDINDEESEVIRALQIWGKKASQDRH
ncbi:MAG: CCA tRNA nucleotidyltransferase [Candidatus Latescibacteria bacterium]|jgi:tRNA nucleotidyltransferase (CCA-adding enzyme)|nr:CCA tRNA nucleotidyltransferase [Candidatus Latescibacterota bacterium]